MGLEVLTNTIGFATAIAASPFASIEQQRQMRKEMQKASREQRANNEAEAARERRQQIREERIRRAQIINAAEQTGVSDSSGAIGSVAALATNLNSNLSMNQGRLERAQNISIFQQNAADAQMRASLYKQIGDTAMAFLPKPG
jgi:uncharacterized membrane-anchored protein YjiN (DUF445 family)